MAAFFGPVLTNAVNVDRFLEYYKAGKFTAAKVVVAWGLDTGWGVAGARRRLVEAVPNLIVRTKTGDPSNRSALWYLHPDTVVAELRPWLLLRPDLLVELGNEPDVVWEQRGRDEHFIWGVRWWLDETVKRLRVEFPQARLISPSVRIGVPGWERWTEIMADVMRTCDAVSLHLYGWHKIVGDGKGEYVAARRLYDKLFPGKQVAVTELGIHHPPMPPAEKLALYRDFAALVPASWRWVLFYHYNERRDIHPYYHIPIEAVVRR